MDSVKRSHVWLSKLLSLMLRHRPDEFGITLDAKGFGDLEEVLQALQNRDQGVGIEDIESVVYKSEKQRFEIAEGRIRARYGHSIPIELDADPIEPPEYLYKGIDLEDVEQVLKEGLSPTDRRYVHLSFDSNIASRLGGNRSRPGAVVRVDALRAHQEGIPFYDCGPTILTPEVSPEFITLEEQVEARHVSGSEEAEKQGPVSYGRKRRFGGRK